MSDGLKLIARLIEEGSVNAFRDLSQQLFIEDEQAVYRFVRDHYRRYGRLPEIETVEQETGTRLPETPEPSSYYRGKVADRDTYNRIRGPFSDLRNSLQGMDIEAARRAIGALSTVSRQSSPQQDIRTIQEVGRAILAQSDERRLQGGELSGITTGWSILDSILDGYQRGDLITWAARPKMGKASSLDADVLLSSGLFLKMRGIRVGDSLASVDGEPSVVTGIFPQGMQRTYKVAFSDGRATEVSEDHLWKVYYRTWEEPRILQTRDVAELLSKRRYRNRLWIDRVNGDFGHLISLPIDPYLLGVLIGDGCLAGSGVTFSTADSYILEKVIDTKPGDCYIKHIDRYDYGIRNYDGQGGNNSLKNALRVLGLNGKTSKDKFIPSVYLTARRKERLSLLQGLMDTDGAVSGNSASYSTVSEVLAKDVVKLARSLGYVSSYRRKIRLSGISFHVYIGGKGKSEIFSLGRKRNEVDDSEKDRRLTFVSCEYVGMKECQCISVSHPSHLYITDDYIVTHNTYYLLHQALAAWQAQYCVMFVSMEMTLNQLGNRYLGMMNNVNPNMIRRGQLTSRSRRVIGNCIETMDNADRFHLIAGNFKKRVEDVEGLMLEIEPDIVYIDGAYLMKTDVGFGRRGGRYETATDVVDYLKEMTITHHKPIVMTTKFSKAAGKRGAEGSLETMGFTDAISTHSSVIFSLTEGIAPYQHNQRTVNLLAGREGEDGCFQFHFGFSPMNFGWVTPEEEAERAAQHQRQIEQESIADSDWGGNTEGED